jgi:glucosamine kinase
MILIADSGSTKTAWRMIRNDGSIEQAATVGLSPRFQSTDEIHKEIENSLRPAISETVDQLFFYGTGCSSPMAIDIASKALSKSFPSAKIEVHEDLLGAARGLCGHEPGIACILGTGSNSCLFDGKDIIYSVPNLGPYLGDEGSGGYLGKRLVQDFILNDMPPEIHAKFEKRFKLTREDVLDNVYNKPYPHRYLGGFTKFLFDNLKTPYAYKLVYDSFSLFFEKTVCKYSNYKDYKVHFVGSIAFYYSGILRQVAGDKGITVKNIMEDPIAGLTLYHQGKQ